MRKEQLSLIAEHRNHFGDVNGLTPRGDIHRVRNGGATSAISLHIYGTDVSGSGSSVRRHYDLPEGPATTISRSLMSSILTRCSHLAAAIAVIDAHSEALLLPLRFPTNRTRMAANVADSLAESLAAHSFRKETR